MPVSDESQVREWLFRGSDLALGAGEEVGEVDEEAAVALPLVRRQRQNAGDVEILREISSFSGLARLHEGMCGMISLYHHTPKTKI